MIQSYKNSIKCNVQELEQTNKQTDDSLIQQFDQFHNTKHWIIKIYIAIILILFLAIILILFLAICITNGDMQDHIMIVPYLIVFIVTYLIIRNKNTMQYAMYINNTLNIIYHILYLTTIICVSILFIVVVLIPGNDYNKLADWGVWIYIISLIIKLILDIVIYYIYKDDYNNAIKLQQDDPKNNITTKEQDTLHKNEQDTKV